jgi:colanic acid/amylovoran biosynthesis glycosyltransferase
LIAPVVAAGAAEAGLRARGPVAIVVSRFPKITETFILRELDELERRGQAVRLVTLVRERPDVVHPAAVRWLDRLLQVPLLSRELLAANLRRFFAAPGRWSALALRLIAGSWRRPGFALRTLAAFLQGVAVAERLRAEGITHVHGSFATHPATVGWVARELAGIDFSFTVHAHDLYVHQLLLADKIRAARFVRTISAHGAERLRALAPDATARIAVLRLGVPAQLYADALDAAPAGEPPLVVAVAALEEYKGIAVLVDACAELARRGVELRCQAVGQGPLRAALAERIRRAGLAPRFELVGAIDESGVAALLARAAVVVQPSVVARSGQMEGIPVALMEAMAAGKPVVASRLAGIPELVAEGENGWLVPPGDVRALADALEQALADPEEAARRGRAGRERVRAEFDLERATERFLVRLERELPEIDDPGTGALLTAAGVSGRASLRGTEERMDSTVRRWLVSGGTGARELVEKRHRSRPGESAPAPERAAREHALLVELAHALPAGCAVPAALALDVERSAVLMAACAGEPLDHRIRRLRGGPLAQLLEDLRRVGRWLAEYQRLPHSDGERARGTVRTHGDFWPGNLFVSAERIEAIDFEGASIGAPELDVADFLVELRLFFLRPWNASHYRRSALAFLAGWGGDLSPALAVAITRAAEDRRARGAAAAGPLVRILRARALRRLAASGGALS